MNKKIIIFLFITTLSHGMEKTFDNKNIQKMLSFPIQRQLFAIAIDSNKQFSQEHLNNFLYVNAILYVTERGTQFKGRTLLSLAFKTQQFQKIEQLLDAKADVTFKVNNNLLNKIALKRCNPKHAHNKEKYLILAQLLLKHGADPDFRLQPHDPTPLMITICNHDPEYAHVLIWSNADPCKKGIWIDNSLKNSFEVEKASKEFCEKNAFEIETTGWLKKMVDEKERMPYTLWLFKNYIINTNIFPLEIIQLILHTVLNICKHQQI